MKGRQEQQVKHRSITVDGVRLFYREAGPKDGPTLLLLHGFPSSSFMFRELIPQLSEGHRVIAPDYPGFGHSDFPDPQSFSYTFDHLARVIHGFANALDLERCVMYLQDYGAPVGLRFALRAPDRIAGLIVQNGNAYEEGLSAAWDPLKAHWTHPTASSRELLRGWLTEEGVRLQYTAGLRDEQVELLSPDTWELDWARLRRPGNIDVQLDLFADYQSNVALYPRFQQFFRQYRPPTLIVWGELDPFFSVSGARAYLQDLPEAELHLLEAGHFALETHAIEIGTIVRAFLDKRFVADGSRRISMKRAR
jgi:pimeloyl-ACP methyl ester carboxylesterase